jgi:hypothetical protein
MEVFMNQPISHTNYFVPVNLRMFLLALRRNLASSFSDNLNLAHNGVLNQVIILKPLPRDIAGELPDFAGGYEHIQ